MSAVSPHRRVAFVVSSLHGGGAEAVGVAWMRWFADQGHEVAVVLVSDKPTEDVVPDGVFLEHLGRAGSHTKKIRGISSFFVSWRADAAIALQTYPSLLTLAAARITPRRSRPIIVVSEHNLISLGLPQAPMGHRLKIAIAKRTYRYADHVIVASHAVGGEMVSAFGVAGERCSVVPNPALAKVTSGPAAERVRGTATGLQIVLACRLVPQKRPHLAIDAAVRMIERGIQTEVVSFGGGPLLDETIARAKQKNVTFTPIGWVENWFDQIGPNAVILLPSYREGFGNVLVEAAAKGCPSVAISNAMGVADAIIPGITGELALNDDPDSIADALIAASHLDVTGINEWLDRFSAPTSGTLLERTIEYATKRASRNGQTGDHQRDSVDVQVARR
jgi:glycosyltransferase involved in cell wall biosynthesis